MEKHMPPKKKTEVEAAPMPAITAQDIANTEAKPDEGKMRVYVLRATWIGEARQDIGTALDLPVDDAVARIEAGIVTRTPPEE